MPRTKQPLASKAQELFLTEGRAAVIAGSAGRDKLAMIKEALPILAKLGKKKFFTVGDESFPLGLRILGDHRAPGSDDEEVDYVLGAVMAEAGPSDPTSVNDL